MERTAVIAPGGDDRWILGMERRCRRRNRCGAVACTRRERATVRGAADQPWLLLAFDSPLGREGQALGSSAVREMVKVVGSDEDLLRTVGATPGSVGLIDVYAINSSVKVLRVDGKLPFDVGYALKGN